ncbi:MAG TPA: hypothetical protein VK845_15195 [Gemmatimonadales bacterium]|nr:hypothetical protein [Gemmatimonadales bacterium]
MARRTLPRRETLAFIEGLTDQIVLQDMRTGEHTVPVLDPFPPATGLLRYGNLDSPRMGG